MAEMNQFGSVQPGSAQVCGRCEALLMDVLDGAASGEDQQFFDTHVASCTGCSEILADARRGGAWLEMLRDPRPEPRAALLERILAQTSGLIAGGETVSAPVKLSASGLQVMSSGGATAMEGAAVYAVPVRSNAQGLGLVGGARVLPFRLRETLHRVGQTMLQPRLAMTAAMAFFSIALTLNLTGVHVSALRISDLRPSNLRREFYEANAHVVRYCDNLRVVYELEARTHDLQRSSDSDDQGASPATGGDGRSKGAGSDGDQPADQNDKPKSMSKPGPGTSRREATPQDGRLVAELPQMGDGAHCDNNFLAAGDTGRSVSTMHLKGDLA